MLTLLQRVNSEEDQNKIRNPVLLDDPIVIHSQGSQDVMNHLNNTPFQLQHQTSVPQHKDNIMFHCYVTGKMCVSRVGRRVNMPSNYVPLHPFSYTIKHHKKLKSNSADYHVVQITL